MTVISGCLESQKAHMIAGLRDAPVRLLIAENELKAKNYMRITGCTMRRRCYPAKDLIFYQADYEIC